MRIVAINECELGRHNCDAETQVCEDTPYSLQCNCNDQHELDPTTKKCKRESLKCCSQSTKRTLFTCTAKNGCTDLGGTKKCAQDNKECYDDVKGEGLAGYRCACKLGFEENYNGTCISKFVCYFAMEISNIQTKTNAPTATTLTCVPDSWRNVSIAIQHHCSTATANKDTRKTSVRARSATAKSLTDGRKRAIAQVVY